MVKLCFLCIYNNYANYCLCVSAFNYLIITLHSKSSSHRKKTVTLYVKNVSSCFLFVFKTQVQVYEEDFKREKREKESLQQQLRAASYSTGVSY